MGKPTKSEPRPFLDIAKTLLVDIFAEAKNTGGELSAEMALSRMRERLRTVCPNPSQVSESAKRTMRRSLKSDIARLKEIHHFAVDQFYKTYFPEESGPGRGRLPEEDRLEAQQVRDTAGSWTKTMEALEPDLRPGATPRVKHAKDKYRKRAAGIKPQEADSTHPSKVQDLPDPKERK